MAPTFDKEYVLKTVEERGIRFIRFWFTDVLGQLKSFAIADTELELAFDEGMGFDGSSIDGYTRIQESDMIAFPDPATFKILPWRPEEGGVASMFCNVVKPDGTPFDGDPRYALRRMLDKAAGMGLTMYVGPELEYFYFADEEGTEVLDHGGYFDLTPLDVASDLRRETVLTLEKLGIAVEYSHHEVAPSQHEIDLRYAEAGEMADIVMTYRLAVKEIAYANGVYATFMPKPIAGENGSGMHVHQSLFNKDGNAFFDANDPEGYNLSALGKSYIAGLLKYAPEFCAVTNQFVNSYKRLVPGYEAPVYVSWARRNRSALVRVPMYKPGKENATRIEFRSPDPTCNPYLAFALMLGAGLKGVEGKYPLPEPVEHDIFEMDAKARAEAGITSLPGSLWEALEEFKQSVLANEVLGDHIFGKVIANKEKEWDMFRTHVTDFEINRYLPML